MKSEKLLAIAIILIWVLTGAICLSESSHFISEQKNDVTNLYGKLPLTFIENKGQLDKQVKFYARCPKAIMYFTPSEVVFHFTEKEEAPNPKALEKEEPDGSKFHVGKKRKELVMRISFLDSNPNVIIEGQEELQGKVSIFKGRDSSRWLTSIPTYKKIIYHNLWDGIDIVYYGMPEYGMKYDTILHPNAEPAKIKMRYAGQNKLSINSEEELVIKSAFGEIVEKKKYIYQEIKGNRKEIAGKYSMSKDIISLSLENYDKNYPLIIDPGLVYSAFLGGTHSEWGNGISVDSSGCAYIAGGTYSADFPITTGVFDTSFNGFIDAFVMKLNASGTDVIYSTFIGGIYDEDCYGIAIDSSGCAYVTGYTNSADFPVTDKAFDRTFSLTTDAFVTKLNADGTDLIYSTFLGGADIDWSYGIVVDSSNRAYVTGNTHSTDFPVTTNPFDSSYNGSYDAFVTKLNSSGSALIYSTFLGGTFADGCYGIAIDSLDCAYVTGFTESIDFPIISGSYDISHNGNEDVFVTKLNASGAGLIYSTFLGSSSADRAEDITVDSSGCAYVTGYTYSNNFPVTTNAFDISYSGDQDVFVTKLNASGIGLVYSTFLGGTNTDHGANIVVDSSNCTYLTGYTSSAEFPATSSAYDTSFGGWTDIFVTRLNAFGTGLIYSTFLGKANEERGGGVSIDSSGCVYVTGFTASTDFPATVGAFDTLYNGGLIDAFVTKIPIPLRIYLIVYNRDGATIYWNSSPGVSYIVEWSIDLLSWNPVPVGPVSAWMDTGAVGYTKKFYRVREE